jgi:hypothetical protein
MKRFLMTAALTCVLSLSVLAGEIPSVGLNSQGPDETTPTTNMTSPGEIPTVNYTRDISDTALSLIQIVVGVIV